MKCNFVTMFMVFLASTFWGVSAYADSPSECSKEPGTSYENSAAVVLAKIKKVTIVSEPPYAVIEIDVKKYWKLLNNDIPKVIHSSAGQYNQDGNYVFFLAKYQRDADYYQFERCSSLVRWDKAEAAKNETILYLNSKNARNVD